VCDADGIDGTGKQVVAAVYDWVDRHAAYGALFRSPFLAGVVAWLIGQRRVRGLLTATVAAGREREAADVARLFLRRWAPDRVSTWFGPNAPADAGAAAVQAILADARVL
jgi:hypothetical protein